MQDDEHHELDDPIRTLILEAGRLMEDGSPEFAGILPSSPQERSERVEALHQITAALHAMMRAAVHLDRVDYLTLAARSGSESR